MKKIIRNFVSFLLVLCMSLSSVPMMSFAKEMANVSQDANVEHVLNEKNNWNISDELIMPGELFYIEPKYECSTQKVQAGVTEFAACPLFNVVNLSRHYPLCITDLPVCKTHSLFRDVQISF